ncbi:adenylate/guanylate cyclase domain-containing protein [Sinorhizobium mexicanum]|uniref:Adenylate/guanylate cyclase domain-containing protein n=1 Tax=Sinorhizobium mexicanum TaxID=375549 RepID=A0A859QC54_9HYPH|nr:adenylate/guanylate cyclase domain-containing protein [Sinorhizobium mexicanum]MBP1887044.1 adenylate cyclase [Sinorhizobium mexicanum]QLL61473.1 adenylate/guanylate cyclase domain-containing protein [Sinorhizobium mexicanum]
MREDDEPTSVSAGPQRKLAVILAADVAGYSRLMERDEEDTHARLQGLLRDVVRPAVETHRGRIFKTAGDGFLAEFASPIEAVRCAVDLQRVTAERNEGLAEDRRLAFRMGVNLGDVLADREDIFGDGVNIAARLEAIAEPGGVLISHSVHEHVDRKLPIHFVDQGECVLKNIARPVRTFRLAWETGDSVSSQREDNGPAGVPTLPQVASIAVLPFATLTSDAEQGYFADGLAEDLITDLSKVEGLLVIARHSSFAYRDRLMDLRMIARELGVRYLIEGSVRRAAARVRINAQLIDASSASCLWAERLDRDVADIFALQDEVVGKVINALAHALPSTKPLPKRRVTDLEAYDLFVRGRALATQSLRETRAARPLLAKAIEIDPGFAGAHAWLAMSHHFDALYYGQPTDKHRAAARAAAETAVEIDPENADAHIVLGYLRAYEGEFEAGVAEFEQGLRLNPNHSAGWAHLADLRVFEGRATEAVECAENSFRLNPYPPGDHYSFLGWAQYAACRYQDAAETLRHPQAGGPGSKRNLAAALAQLGRTAEAHEVGRGFLSEFPNFSARQWGRTQPFRDDADRQHFINGYIKAGLPE